MRESHSGPAAIHAVAPCTRRPCDVSGGAFFVADAMTDTDLNAWDRQPGESAKAFAAFVLYRGMGPGRSLDAVCRKCGKSAGLIDRWSRQRGWVKRAAAWDAFLDRTVTQPAAIDVRRMTQEQLVGKDGERLRQVNDATFGAASGRHGTSADRRLYYDKAGLPDVQRVAQTDSTGEHEYRPDDAMLAAVLAAILERDGDD